MKRLSIIAAALILFASLGSAQTTHRGPTKQRRIDSDFVYAIQKGDLGRFYSLLKRGANVNAQGESRTTALMVAAMNNQTEFLVALIAKGARLNAKNAFGNTALMYAADGHVEMVRWLLIAGADVNAENESGWTALKFVTNSTNAQQANYQRVIELLTAAKPKKRL